MELQSTAVLWELCHSGQRHVTCRVPWKRSIHTRCLGSSLVDHCRLLWTERTPKVRSGNKLQWHSVFLPNVKYFQNFKKSVTYITEKRTGWFHYDTASEKETIGKYMCIKVEKVFLYFTSRSNDLVMYEAVISSSFPGFFSLSLSLFNCLVATSKVTKFTLHRLLSSTLISGSLSHDLKGH